MRRLLPWRRRRHVSSNTFPRCRYRPGWRRRFEICATGLGLARVRGGPAILPLSLANMTQQYLPDAPFSGRRNPTFPRHSRTLLGCGTVPVSRCDARQAVGRRIARLTRDSSVPRSPRTDAGSGRLPRTAPRPRVLQRDRRPDTTSSGRLRSVEGRAPERPRRAFRTAAGRPYPRR